MCIQGQSGLPTQSIHTFQLLPCVLVPKPSSLPSSMFKLSTKISELHLKPSPNIAEKLVVVREYDEKKDTEAVEEVERQCEFGSSKGKPSVLMDVMGDPVSRVRQSPSYVMLVAEYGEQKEIVGMIMGSVKTVTRGKKGMSYQFPVYVKVAYILGLRVLPSHRRLGLGTKLAQKLEEWCMQRGAEYSYMATECTNKASINLFTLKCSYVKFRTPTVLVHPVHAHKKPLGSGIRIIRLTSQVAESIYRQVFASSELFPKDIEVILSNKLNLGTFMAMPKKFLNNRDLQKSSDGRLPPSFAILSVWNTKEVFKLQVKGISSLTYAGCVASRVMDTWMPWLKIPSIPNLFSPFGVYFLYGLHMQGKGASGLMKNLCSFAHNMARNDVGCGALVAEVGKWDPVKEGIPHWRKFSWAEDIWCMKRLGTSSNDDEESDWTTPPPSSSVIFVDPRDF
ncbi:hypothetical protein IFM89_003145 [Coptis chinensis]|uniref:N-acetyltransferase domain-containing protein n=1 Tax=Coptis chinensis TaxID=261450 RepID=A0A835LYX4_9MAGN|nr:hypothetical protein IFM89_003145 [Coptis chinensis]